VESLRRTIDTERALDRPTVTEPVILTGDGSPTAEATAGARSRGWAVGAIAALAIAAGVALLAAGIGSRGNEEARGASTGAVAATAPGERPVPSVPDDRETGPEVPGATAPQPGPGRAATAAGSGVPSQVRLPTRVRPPWVPRPAPPLPRASATSKLPDVDPTPF
jgi:hypothetical protein